MNAGKNKSEENPPKANKISVALAHNIFGHMGEDQPRETAKNLGYEITIGSLHPCEACETGKARQKKNTKSSENVTATERNKRVFLDILTIKKPRNGNKVTLTKMNWRITVDSFSGIK